MLLDEAGPFGFEVLKISGRSVLHQSTNLLLKWVDCIDLLLLHDLLVDHVALGSRMSVEGLCFEFRHHDDVLGVVLHFVGKLRHVVLGLQRLFSDEILLGSIHIEDPIHHFGELSCKITCFSKKAPASH